MVLEGKGHQMYRGGGVHRKEGEMEGGMARKGMRGGIKKEQRAHCKNMLSREGQRHGMKHRREVGVERYLAHIIADLLRKGDTLV